MATSARINVRRRALVVALLAGSSSAGVAGPLKYSVIAYPGRQVAGMPAGVVSWTCGYPLMNPAGTVVCPVYMSGPGITADNDTGVLSGAPESVGLIVREGDAAPGLAAGVLIGDIGASVLDQSGRLLLMAGLTGPGVTTANDRVVWTGSIGALMPLIRKGAAAPGLPAGVLLGDFGGIITNGDWVYSGNRTGLLLPLTGQNVTTANDQSLYAGGPPMTLLAREGTAAPGLGVNLGAPVLPAINESGQMAMWTPLAGTGNSAVWYGTPGAMSLVLRVGDSAPGMPGVTIASIVGAVDIDATGRIGITATLAGAVTAANDAAMWYGYPGALTLLVRKGDPAPGMDPGITLSTLSYFHFRSSDVFALTALVTGPGVGTGNARCVWTGTPGNLHLVARAGDLAPGLPAGVVFSALLSATPDADGRVAFSSLLTGAGVVSSNNSAWFATNRLGQLVFVARTGTPLEIEPGLSATATNLLGKLGTGESGLQTTFGAGKLGVVLFNSPAGAGGSVVADLDSTCRADVSDQPLGVTVPLGSPAGFTAAATGQGPLTFRWRRNGVDLIDGPNISGAASASLSILAVGPGDVGVYDWAVTNPCGVSFSAGAALGISSVCYPNCDGSTTPPILNVLDFTCFLNKFAAGDSSANCDGSTTPPVLNVLDFTCFLNRFAAGCT